MTVTTPESLRTDGQFTTFGNLVIKAHQDLDVYDLGLPSGMIIMRLMISQMIARHTILGLTLRPSA